MGVDWKTCNYCEDNFPDCGEYVYCEYCGKKWCSYECASEEGYKEELDEDGSFIADSCSYCRGEIFEEDELLDFALKLLNIGKNELIEKYKLEAK